MNNEDSNHSIQNVKNIRFTMKHNTTFNGRMGKTLEETRE